MRKNLYPRLAAQNLKKNSQYFLPYILTCIVSVSMYFIICSLSMSNSLSQIYGGAQLRSLLSMSKAIAVVFFTVFLFYTNSFLTKRRTKEYGLYSVLGMEKKHVCIMSLFETLYTTLISLTGGIALGVLLSKLVYLVLAKILHFEVKLGFEFHKEAFILTITLFLAIFFIIYLNTVRIIGRTSAVDLLHGDKAGEREPKTKILLTIIGVATLAAGYIIAIVTKSPLDAIGLFVLAAILVMIGTYCLFTAGSIALLKLLRKNKKYYYKSKHFVSVSGMMYRMKQNAVGLASICILCTAVLIMISTTASLYGGMEDLMRTRYPRNYLIEARHATSQTGEKVADIVNKEAEQNSINIKNLLSYRCASFAADYQDGIFYCRDRDGMASSIMNFNLVLLEDYNRDTGKNETLDENEVLIQPVNGRVDFESMPFEGGVTLNIKSEIDDFESSSSSVAYLVKTYYVVVKDEQTIVNVLESSKDAKFEDGAMSYIYNFDTDADSETQIKFYNTLRDKFEEEGIEDSSVENAEESRNSFYSLYGGLLFIGIFLGFIFMVATVLIIYYKQVSEGYDDRERFDIMQKVGMDKQEVRRCVRSQVLTVFFLPLVTALIHLCFAFPIITRLLAILNLTNISIFVIGLAITTVAFAAIYAGVYVLTAKAYYRIVT